ncbi:MAG: amino acid adenylation domain-containing protein [Lachnospiraceae bacterium]|nr:amino acid adenylation domain-containing protein [Lachnospiraceae bacterium]
MSILEHDVLREEIKNKLSYDGLLQDDQNLLALGLTSLQIMRLLNMCKKEGVTVSFGKLMSKPTLANWMSLIAEKQGRDTAVKAGRADKRTEGPFEMTDVQYAYWVGRVEDQQLGGISTHAYMEFEGKQLDIEKLETAWKELHLHHPMLRARFTREGMQEIGKAPYAQLFLFRDLVSASADEKAKYLEAIRERMSHRRLDIENGQVSGMEVSKISEEDFRIHMDLDLMVADVQSLKIILRDLVALYHGKTLPVYSSQFDFATYLKEEKERNKEAVEVARQYWDKRIDTFPEGPMLPLRKTPEQLNQVRFYRREHVFSADKWENMKKLAANWETTTAMLLLAVYAKVIERWSENSHFIINIPMFNRNTEYEGIEDVVSDFTTINLLEVDMRNEQSFYELVKSIQKQMHEDMTYSAYSGVQIQRDLVKKKKSQSVLAPVVFACNLGDPLFEQEFVDTFGECTYMISQTPQIWLDFQIFENEKGLNINWDSVEELFIEGMLDDMFSALVKSIDMLATDLPEDADWEVLPANQLEARAKQQTITRTTTPRGIHEGFFEVAKANGSKVAVIDANTKEETTYGELRDAALRIGGFFQEKAVFKTGIMMQLPKGLKQIQGAYGILASNNYYIPVSISQPMERLEKMVEAVGVTYILTDHENGDGKKYPEGIKVIFIEDILTREPMEDIISVNPDDIAYIIFTSGSTGNPKGVVISHDNAENTIQEVNRLYGVTEQDRVLALSNIDFDLSVYDLFGLLSAGGSIVTIGEDQRKDARVWAEAVKNCGVTVWNTVPTLLDMLLIDTAERNEHSNSLNKVFLSGDWIGLDIPQRLLAFAPQSKLYSMGGATEGGIWSNYYPVSVPLNENWTSIPYGYPLSGQCYRVVDEKGRDCPDWKKGELHIGGYGVAQGYAGSEALTKAHFYEQNGMRWYRTGDYGRFWNDGIIEFMGRKDQQKKIRGHRIELNEIEIAMEKCSGVKQAVVLAQGEERGEKYLAAMITPTSDAEFMKETEVLQNEELIDLCTRLKNEKSELSNESQIRNWNEAALCVMNEIMGHYQVFDETALEEFLGKDVILPQYKPLLRQWFAYGNQKKTYISKLEDDRLKRLLENLPDILEGKREAWEFIYQQEKSLSPFEIQKQLPTEADHQRKAIALISQFAKTKGHLRVLDFGSRMEEFSDQVLHTLKTIDQESVYTLADHSAAFLPEQKGANTKLLKPDEQLLVYQEEHYDVIILRNSLHRLKNITKALAYFKELLASDGIILLEEKTSQEIMQSLLVGLLEKGYSQYEDFRKGTNRALPEEHTWREILTKEGFAITAYVNGNEEIGWMLSLAQPKKEYAPEIIRQQLEKRLPDYMIPKVIQCCDQLPVTANGKLDRKEIAKSIVENAVKTGRQEAGTKTELALAKIWKNLFQREEIGIEDNYFELGGDSLLATRLINQVRKELQTELSIGTVFDHPTIYELAQLIENSKGAVTELEQIEADLENRYEPFPLTDVQYAYWIGRSGLYKLGDVSTHCYFELKGKDLAIEKLNRAWNAVVKRHSMMRVEILKNGQQRILEQVEPYEIAIRDCRSLSGEALEKALADTRNELANYVFDLQHGPLFHVEASLLPEDEVRLHIGFDNLIFDGFSMFYVIQEWAKYYYDENLKKDDYSISFREYVIACEKLKQSEQYKLDREYWQQEIETLPPAPQLPVKNGKEEKGFTRRSAKLSPAQWESLKSFAQGHNITPVSMLLGIFAEVIKRWSKQPEFTLNLTQFRRLPLHPEVEKLIGDFTTLNLLRIDNEQGKNLIEKIQIIQKQLMSDLEHSLYSGVEVERALANKWNDTQGSLMPIVFTSGLGGRELNDDEWLGKLEYSASQTPQVWLDHQVMEINGGIILSWDAREDVFAEGVLDEMFSTYEKLLIALAEDHSLFTQSRSVVSYTPGPARIAANMTSGEIAAETLDSLFINQVRKTPKAAALIWNEGSMSYETLYFKAKKLASKLLGEKGTVYGIYIEKSYQQIVAAVAILLSGGVYLPLDIKNPVERIGQIIRDAEVKTILTSDETDVAAGEFGVHTMKVTDEAAEFTEILESNNSPTDLAYIIYTSGSTGVPKGVAIDHKGAVNTILDVNERICLSVDDRLFGISSLNFDLSVYDIFGTLAAGAALFIPREEDRKNPGVWGQMIAKYGVTIWNSVPAFLQMMTEYYKNHDSNEVEGLRCALLSGDWIPLDLYENMQKISPRIKCYGLGGATEASIWSNWIEIPKQIPENWESIPYGRPLKNQRYYVLNQNQEICPDYVSGMLYIAGDGLAVGYYNNPELTNLSFTWNEELQERLYATGDMGRYWKDGTLEFLGRKDKQVKINGYRVELGEIESAAKQLPDIKEAVAVLWKEENQTVLAMAYTLQSADIVLSPEEVFKQLKQSVPEYMIPELLKEMDKFPLTANGKINRKEIQLQLQIISKDKKQSERICMPETEGEQIVHDIMAELIKAEKLPCDAHFFEIGGNSIIAIQVMNRLNERFHCDLGMEILFEHPTIQELAKEMERAGV